MQVRRLGPGEREVLRRVRLAALATDPAAFGSTHGREETFGTADWDARLGPPGATMVVGEVGAEPAGMAWALPDPGDDRTVRLLGMWVAPPARGSGAADLLVAEVVRWAEERGVGRVQLTVVEGNERAERLYRRHGFRRTGRTEVRTRDGLVEAEMVRSSSPPAGEDGLPTGGGAPSAR